MKADDGEFSVELLMLNQSDGYIERIFSIVDKVRNNVPGFSNGKLN